MASVTQIVVCGICNLAIHKNSFQKHQRQHNLSTADDRACLRHWDLIMANGLVRAKELQAQSSNVTDEIVSHPLFWLVFWTNGLTWRLKGKKLLVEFVIRQFKRT